MTTVYTIDERKPLEGEKVVFTIRDKPGLYWGEYRVGHFFPTGVGFVKGDEAEVDQSGGLSRGNVEYWRPANKQEIIEFFPKKETETAPSSAPN